ncbi:MAG: type 1 glutamine amidotransferase [Candidatus Methylomirabilales bacterium]
MTIVVIKHVDCEGLGIWEDFCRQKGVGVEVVSLHRGDPLPSPLEFQGVISLGGPMNVYEEDAYPFLKTEDQFIRQVLAEGVPFLGICLGGQLLAKAAGGLVILNAAQEIGWHRVTLNEMGERDHLLAGLPESFTVFQWHTDTFRPPIQAVPLASSTLCEDQAFRLRGIAYALQFHLEVTPNMIGQWVREYELVEPDDPMKPARILAEVPALCERLRPESRQLLWNFLSLVRRCAAARQRRGKEKASWTA